MNTTRDPAVVAAHDLKSAEKSAPDDVYSRLIDAFAAAMPTTDAGVLCKLRAAKRYATFEWDKAPDVTTKAGLPPDVIAQEFSHYVALQRWLPHLRAAITAVKSEAPNRLSLVCDAWFRWYCLFGMNADDPFISQLAADHLATAARYAAAHASRIERRSPQVRTVLELLGPLTRSTRAAA